MRINGDWVPDENAVYEPVVRAKLEAGTGGWVECTFLVDTGAETTLLSADVVEQLGVPTHPSPRQLLGIGGLVDVLSVPTKLRFTQDSGAPAVVNGPFEGLPTGREGELSVLGRDVLGNFAVILDRQGSTVCLLAGRHRYVIQES